MKYELENKKNINKIYMIFSKNFQTQNDKMNILQIIRLKQRNLKRILKEYKLQQIYERETLYAKYNIQHYQQEINQRIEKNKGIKQVVKKIDENKQVDYNRANMLYLQKRVEEASQYYDYAIKRNPQNAQIDNNTEKNLTQLNRIQEVLQYYDNAIQLNPENADIYNNKAITLLQLNRLEEALLYFDNAIQINSNISTFYYNKAITLEKLNRFQEALYYQTYTIFKNLQNNRICANQISIEQFLQKFEEDSQYFDQLIQNNFEKLLINNDKANTFNILNQFKVLQQNYYKTFNRLKEEDNYECRAFILQKLNQFEKALQYYHYLINKILGDKNEIQSVLNKDSIYISFDNS